MYRKRKHIKARWITNQNQSEFHAQTIKNKNKYNHGLLRTSYTNNENNYKNEDKFPHLFPFTIHDDVWHILSTDRIR